MIVYSQKKVTLFCTVLDVLVVGLIIWLYLNGFFGQPILSPLILLLIATGSIIYTIAFQNPSTNLFNFKQVFEKFKFVDLNFKIKLLISVTIFLTLILIGIYFLKNAYFATYLLLFLTYIIIESVYLIAVMIFKSKTQVPQNHS